MTNIANGWAMSFAEWVLTWGSCLSYWIACIGGSASYILYIATKNKKYAQFTIGSIIIYTLIVASLSVI